MPARRVNGAAAGPFKGSAVREGKEKVETFNGKGFEHRTGPANLAAIQRIVKSYGKNPASQREIDEVLSILARREAARQAGARNPNAGKGKPDDLKSFSDRKFGRPRKKKSRSGRRAKASRQILSGHVYRPGW